jgi:hypothetical protein
MHGDSGGSTGGVLGVKPPPQHHEKYILKINNFMNEEKDFFFLKYKAKYINFFFIHTRSKLS